MQPNLYRSSGPTLEPALKDGDTAILYKVGGSKVHILSVYLVSNYQQLIYDRMDESPSWRFRLLTKMPFSYMAVPSTIRNRVFKAKGSITRFREEALGPVECL